MPRILRMEAEQNLRALQIERAEACAKLEAESATFLASKTNTERDIRRFNLIYRLLNYEIQSREEHFHSVLQHKLAAMALIQGMVGETAEDEDVRQLTIAAKEARLVDFTIGLIERGIEAMRALNGRGDRMSSSSSSDGAASTRSVESPPPPPPPPPTSGARQDAMAEAGARYPGFVQDEEEHSRKRRNALQGGCDVANRRPWDEVHMSHAELAARVEERRRPSSTSSSESPGPYERISGSGFAQTSIRPAKRYAFETAFGHVHRPAPGAYTLYPPAEVSVQSSHSALDRAHTGEGFREPNTSRTEGNVESSN